MRKLCAVLLLNSFGCSYARGGPAQAPRAAEADRFGEILLPAEDAVNREIANLSVSVLKKSGASNPVTRDVHAKHHGCLRARFIVNAAEALPAEYRAGVFARPGKEYPAWIRFSNGSPKIQADKEGDARGMAVKLVGVEGDKLLEGERTAKTQDFLMINHDAFFIKDGKDYLEFFKRLNKGSSPAWFFFGRLPWRWTEFQVARRIRKNGAAMTNPLLSEYFSATPYALGENVVKYSARPCMQSSGAQNHFQNSPDFLRLNMERFLKVGREAPACFDFMVQRRGHSRTMSVEDSRVPWDQEKSGFVPVATIVVDAQDFSSAEQMRFCENLSFTPWHSLLAHRPLGNINRTRKAVYEAVSKFRHESNHELRQEPEELRVPKP